MNNPGAHISEKLISRQEFSVGNDLVFLPNFELSFNEDFKNRVYNDVEINYCESFSEPLLRFASTWAAKEAVYKAVKQVYPLQSLPVSKIAIKRDKPSGTPSVSLPGDVVHLDISVSITHDGDYVWAVALVKHIPA